MIKIALIEDSREEIDFFKSVISNYDNVEFLGVINDLQLIDSHRNLIAEAEYLFVDIYLHGRKSISEISKMKKYNKECEIIMYSFSDAYNDLYQSILNGAAGYIKKSRNKVELKTSVDLVLSGGAFISPMMAQKILSKMKSNFSLVSNKLSSKEIETLRLLSQGWSYKKIAQEQEITIDGIKTRVKRMYKKLNVTNKLEAIFKFNQITKLSVS